MSADIQDLVRRALRDRRLWAEATATETMRCHVFEELERLNTDVGNQMSGRGAEIADLRERSLAGEIPRDEYERRRREHRTWHTQATGFRAVVQARMGELRPEVGSTHRRLSDQANKYRELALKLTKAIYRHQAEEITDSELYAVLEEITLPNGIHGEITLFELAHRLLYEGKVA